MSLLVSCFCALSRGAARQTSDAPTRPGAGPCRHKRYWKEHGAQNFGWETEAESGSLRFTARLAGDSWAFSWQRAAELFYQGVKNLIKLEGFLFQAYLVNVFFSLECFLMFFVG